MNAAPALTFALALVLALAPSSSAGSADAPEVTDAPGDAGPNHTPLAAGFEDVDILAAWFEGETSDTIDLKIQLAGPSRNRPDALWVQSFAVGDRVFDAGYGWIIPFFQGPFVCETNTVNCTGTQGGFDGATVTTTIPREVLGDPPAGATLTIVQGITSQIYFDPSGATQTSGSVPYDASGEGVPYVLAKGPSPPNATPEPEVAASGGAPTRDPAPTNRSSESPTAAETPGFAALAVLAALLVAARRPAK